VARPVEAAALAAIAARPAATDLPIPATSPERARSSAREVLAQPAYAEADPGLLERAWQAVVEALGELIGQLGGVAGVEWIGAAVLALGVGVVTWVIVMGLGRLRHSTAADEAAVSPAGRDATDWQAAAADHEAAGAWRAAVRCRYRELVAELVAAGRVDDVPGRTPRECLTQATAGEASLHEPMATATTAFETAWYTDTPVGRDDAARVAEATAEVRARLSPHRDDRQPRPVGAAGQSRGEP
jgi:hypothetical protein